jgi:hypothetical protein
VTTIGRPFETFITIQLLRASLISGNARNATVIGSRALRVAMRTSSHMAKVCFGDDYLEVFLKSIADASGGTMRLDS